MSATVIDALVVTLGLDGSMFKRGIKDADDARGKFGRNEAKWQKDSEQAVKKSVDGYRSMRNELLGVAAIFTAGVGLKNFITNTINSAANLGYLSQNLRMSTQDLTSWQRASERAGGSGDGIIAQLKESADTLAQLRSGFGPNESLQNFFRFGGNANDLKDGNTYLLARSRIIADIFKQDPAKAALIAKQIGISEDQFNFLKQGPAAVQALVQAQEKNAAVTERDAKAALELRNRVLDLRDSLQSTATRILLQLAPTLEELFAKLEKGASWVVDHKDDIRDWVEVAVKAIKEFVIQADRFAESVGGWKNVLAGLAVLKFASIAAGLGSIATAVAAIVSAGLSIPGLLIGLGALATYAGYKGAEAFDKWLHPEKFKNKELANDKVHQQNKAVLAGGAGDAKAKSKDELRAEAMRQLKDAGLESRASVVEKLKKMGWSSEQAAGIAASFTQESGLNPSARNASSGAYGIGQWLGSRVKDFKDWAGHDLKGSSLDEQLAFFQFEVTDGKEEAAGDRLRAARTAEDAARIHSQFYERPGQEEANIGRRQRIAGQLAAADRAANAQAVGAMPIAAAASAMPQSTASTRSTKIDTHIDQITIQTNATDAKGIAQSIGPAIEQYPWVAQANTGLD